MRPLISRSEENDNSDITPIVDGDFLPDHPSVLRKTAPPKPRMTGVAKLEAVIFCEF